MSETPWCRECGPGCLMHATPETTDPTAGGRDERVAEAASEALRALPASARPQRERPAYDANAAALAEELEEDPLAAWAAPAEPDAGDVEAAAERVRRFLDER